MISVFYINSTGEPDVLNTKISMNQQGYSLKLEINANRLWIVDKDKLKDELIEKTLENNFDNVRFSYDVLGYPDEVQITVYANELTRRLNISVFEVEYNILSK